MIKALSTIFFLATIPEYLVSDLCSLLHKCAANYHYASLSLSLLKRAGENMTKKTSWMLSEYGDHSPITITAKTESEKQRLM